MPSQEELDAEYSGSDLEAKVRRLESTVNGLMESGLDRLLASGILQFDGIPMRWDTHGQQIEAGGSIIPALYFVQDLSADPSLLDREANLAGYVNSHTSMAILGAFNPSATASIAVRNFDGAPPADSTVTMTTSRPSAGDYAQAELSFIDGDDYATFRLRNGSLILGALESDPISSIEDGTVWYRSDENKLYARINGATVELGATGGGGVGIVTNPFEWQGAWGHDFRFNAGNADLITTAAAANPSGLSGHGWVATALSVTEGSSGDFLSSSDIDPTRIVWNAASDSLVSPRIFGSYAHMLIAAESLGATPTKLCCEVFARFTGVAIGTTESFFGFAAPSTTDSVAAGSAAVIATNSSVFYLKSDNGSDAAINAANTAWHRWRIEVGASTTEWFIDDVSQGTITTETDIWPTAFKAFAGTTGNRNDFDIAWFRVYYE